ncbi:MULTISPECIES: hypothetical protein [Natrialbaceae]|uniref:hypothetical protein n=1 Tax=Natrialbaceae TaxID=1644061 RepID=UPI00207D10DF|nr:hypothetical protein [Natronococcus sp. CG52]
MTDACQIGELVLEMAEAKSMPEPLTEEYSDRVQLAVVVYESLEFTADHTKVAESSISIPIYSTKLPPTTSGTGFANIIVRQLSSYSPQIQFRIDSHRLSSQKY